MTISKTCKIYIAGHNGMVGSAIWRLLKQSGYKNLIGRNSKDLDLTNQKNVNLFFKETQPEIIIDAAARVGGILANSNYPYQFLMENLQIQNNLIEGALKIRCKKFIFLGSSCIYPKLAPQPIKEDFLLEGQLEKTNEYYAVAKITGVKACQAIRKQFNLDFFSLMPTNLYGPNDNFDLKTSHVLPAMIRKFHDAMVNNNSDVKLWGTGSPMREFLHVDDLAEAVLFSIENSLEKHIYNVGSGTDITIKTLAKKVQEVVGHKGGILWDKSKPDGTPRKVLDVSRMNNLGWKAKINLDEGITKTYNWFKVNKLREVKFL